MNISRLHLDKYLLDKAVDEGAELIEERVTGIRQESDGWVLKTKQSTLKTKTVIGADGTKSIVRQRIVGPIPRENLALTTGYMVEGIETDYNLIKFLGDASGYIWAFPREDHTSLGIGIDIKQSRDSKHKLGKFIKSTSKNISILNQWGALVPQIKDVNFYKIPCAGENWILIGDAAGHGTHCAGIVGSSSVRDGAAQDDYLGVVYDIRTMIDTNIDGNSDLAQNSDLAGIPVSKGK